MIFIGYGLLLAGVLSSLHALHLGPKRFFSFLLLAGLFRPSGDVSGQLDLSSIWLLWLIVLCLYSLMSGKLLAKPIAIPAACYAAFLGICIVSLPFSENYATSLGFAARMFAKLTYPFLVLLIAHRLPGISVGWIYSVLDKTCWLTLGMTLVIGGYGQRLWPALSWRFANFLWMDAAFSDCSALITAMSFAGWLHTRKRLYLITTLVLVVSTILMTNRTGILGSALAIAVVLLVSVRLVVSVPLSAGLIVTTSILLFSSEMIRGRMYRSPEAAMANGKSIFSVDTENINDSGRFELWEYLLERYFKPNPGLGAGLGATQFFLYSSANKTGLNHPHSEYVRLLCDVGILGLSAWGISILFCVGQAFWIGRSSTGLERTIAARIVLGMIPGLLVIMAFDSAINCATCVMQYPFAWSGLLVAFQEAERTASKSASVHVGGRRFGGLRKGQMAPVPLLSSPAFRQSGTPFRSLTASQFLSRWHPQSGWFRRL